MIKIFSYPEWFIPWGFYIAKYVNEKAQILPIPHKTKQTSKPQKGAEKTHSNWVLDILTVYIPRRVPKLVGIHFFIYTISVLIG